MKRKTAKRHHKCLCLLNNKLYDNSLNGLVGDRFITVWINNYKVDWQRGEVVINQQGRSIEPRALQVLQVLVDANGQVVAQQDIINKVWGDVIVAPNALQRCITLLRKAFDDDAKRQHTIKTYPKLGYCLIAQVSDFAPTINAKVTPYLRQLSVKGGLTVGGLILAFVMLLIAAFVVLKSPQKIHYNRITPVTSTDAQERGVVLSPDGKQLAYVRVISPEHQQVIIRDMLTNSETVIVPHTNVVGQLAFSLDGSMVSYGQLSLLNDRKCAKLINLDIASQQALAAIDCTDDFIHSAHWIDDNNLMALRQPKNDDAQVFRWDLVNQTAHKLKQIPPQFTHYAYDAKHGQLAFVVNDNGRWQLISGELAADQFTPNQQWPLDFIDGTTLISDRAIPRWGKAKELILAFDNKVYQFDANGEVSQASVLSNDQIYQAIPYQAQQLLVEMGRSDWDVSIYGWLEGHQEHRIINRSIFEESMGQFRPKHAAVSVLSKQAGHNQVWLNEQGQTRQLTKSELGISQYIWSPDGKALAYLSNGKLFYQDMTSNELRRIASHMQVSQLFQWQISEDGKSQLLVTALSEGNPHVVSIDSATGDSEVEFGGAVRWIQKVAPGQLIIASQHGTLQWVNNGSINDIESLKGIMLHWRFYWRNGALYLQDKAFNLWRLALPEQRADIIGQFEQRSSLMTDIAPMQQKILSHHLISESKEIMLLH